MKQLALFGKASDQDQKYTSKIEAPIYTPRGEKPPLAALYDKRTLEKLLIEIRQSNVPDDEKAFLTLAAYRHVVFHYERIADYYAQASKEMQELMESSLLVLIDFNAAIEQGYIKVTKELKEQYLTDYSNE